MRYKQQIRCCWKRRFDKEWEPNRYHQRNDNALDTRIWQESPLPGISSIGTFYRSPRKARTMAEIAAGRKGWLWWWDDTNCVHAMDQPERSFKFTRDVTTTRPANHCYSHRTLAAPSSEPALCFNHNHQLVLETSIYTVQHREGSKHGLQGDIRRAACET